MAWCDSSVSISPGSLIRTVSSSSRAAVVLVMSVIAAMWSQSIPCRIPRAGAADPLELRVAGAHVGLAYEPELGRGAERAIYRGSVDVWVRAAHLLEDGGCCDVLPGVAQSREDEHALRGDLLAGVTEDDSGLGFTAHRSLFLRFSVSRRRIVAASSCNRSL